MLYYHDPIYENIMTLSIDNVILDASISNPSMRDLLDANISMMINGGKVEVINWQGCKPGAFREQTLFRLNEDRSFWLGRGLIGNGTLVERCRLDFNPNKVAGDTTFENIRHFIVRNSRNISCRISRFDLAIDIPVDRAKCFLVKDRRLYIERRHGKELTQYLGAKSSTAGRVKLYNKSVEAKLDYPLTRLELTLDPSKAYEDIQFPVVYFLNSVSMTDYGIKVNDTERFILNAILQGYGTLNDLGRKTRLKIETIMKSYVEQIRISPRAYSKVLAQLAEYLVDDASQVK